MDTERHLLKPKNVIRFVFGGVAIFTIVSMKTGKHFTFKVIKSKPKYITTRYFIQVLKDGNKFHRMARIDLDYNIKYIRDTQSLFLGSDEFKAFEWFLAKLNDPRRLLKYLKIYHEGSCARCGRRLTLPKSIRLGFGPVCYKKIANIGYTFRKR
jgi:hypothetical protein